MPVALSLLAVPHEPDMKVEITIRQGVGIMKQEN